MNDSTQEIIKRLEKLENAVFGAAKKEINSKQKDSLYKGPKGGCLLLISQKFFSEKRTAPETKAELGKKGYHYSQGVVRVILGRLAKTGGPLVALKDPGSRKYVERK